MNVHKNARLTPIGRARIVMQVASGQTPRAAARIAGVARGRCENGSRVIVQVASPVWLTGPRVRAHSTARRNTLSSMRSSPCAISGCKDKQIAMRVGVSPATISRALKRAGLSRM